MSPSWAPDVVGLFTELAAIPSPPGSEREVADRVTAYLRDLGLDVSEDDAGDRIGANAGNLLARLAPSSANGGTPIFLCAHLDTVQPTGPLEPVVEDGIIRNAGGTILGADNKAAVAAMLEAVRLILSENRPHAGIELLFTPKEDDEMHARAREIPIGSRPVWASCSITLRRSARSCWARPMHARSR